MSDKPIIITHLEKPFDFTLFDCKWIPKTAKFVVIGSRPRGSGIIQLLEVCPDKLENIKTIETEFSIKCCSLGAAGYGKKHIATGDFNGNLDIWDLETSQKIYNVNAHKEIINSIDAIGGVNCGASEIATGSRDGIVKVWDVRLKDRPVTIMQSSEDEIKRDCWTVTFGNSFNNEERMVGAGYDNGDVKLFDLRNTNLFWETNLSNGVCSLEFDRKDIAINKLVATTLEGKFHIFDCRTLHPIKGFSQLTEKAHKSTIWCAKHSPQNRDIFMTTGGCGSLCLWKYSYPASRSKKEISDGKDIGVMGNIDLLQNASLSSQPVSSFDWSPDKQGLAICTGFDQCLRLLIVTKLNLHQN